MSNDAKKEKKERRRPWRSKFREQIIIRQVKNHDCYLNYSLPETTKLITDGIFVHLRRKFREYLTISPLHPYSYKFLRSTCLIDSEMKRHLHRYYHIIHPFSLARFYWNCIMIAIYCFSLTVIPVEVVLTNKELPTHFIYFRMLLDICSWIDIFMRFCTGVFRKQNQKVILHPKLIAQTYLKSHFVTDVLSSIPFTLLLEVFPVLPSQIKFILYLKIFRLFTLNKYINDFLEFGRYNYTARVIFKLSTMYAFIILYVTSIMFCAFIFAYDYDMVRLLEYSTNSMKAFIFNLFYFATSILYIIDTDMVPTRYNSIMIMCILTTYFGVFLNVVLLSKFVELYKRAMNTRNKYRSLSKQINEYMQYKGLSQGLRAKIHKYILFKYHKNFYKETTILRGLSTTLQREIMHHNCKSFVEKVEFFKDVPLDAMMRIVNMLRLEIFLPNDVIFQAGVTGSTMYFIYFGRVAVYTESNKEICHLEEGDHFGEIALLINMPRTATVVAISECELYKLNRKDFMEAIAPYPEVSKHVWQLAEERLKKTKEMTETNLSDS